MVYAYAWRTGVIQIGPRVPKGARKIMRGRKAFVEQRMCARARHAYDGTFLVPGIPEAENDLQAHEALLAFQKFANRGSDPEVN